MSACPQGHGSGERTGIAEEELTPPDPSVDVEVLEHEEHARRDLRENKTISQQSWTQTRKTGQEVVLHFRTPSVRVAGTRNGAERRSTVPGFGAVGCWARGADLEGRHEVGQRGRLAVAIELAELEAREREARAGHAEQCEANDRQCHVIAVAQREKETPCDEHGGAKH